VTEVLDGLHVRIGPEVSAEFVPRLGDHAAFAQRGVDSQPSIEPLALDLAAPLADRLGLERESAPRSAR